MSEIFNLSTLCRCCHSDEGNRRFKLLNIAYSVGDGVEIYEFILQETLGIRILQPSMVTASYLICDNCIRKLQIVSEFRQQVLKCEEKFKVYCLNDGYLSNIIEEESPLPIEIKKEKNTLEVDVKHPIEGNIKNEENENYLKIEDTQINDDAPFSKIVTPNRNIKSKYIKEINKSEKECSEKYMKYVYTRVMLEIKTENGTTYKCKACEKTSSNAKYLYDHIQSDHSDNFKCVHCTKNFKTPQVLRRHITVIHNRPTYDCRHCETQFRTLKSKIAHEKTHRRHQSDFKCDICQKVLSRKGTLIKHIMTHEISNKIHVCDQCGWSFHQRVNLDAHIKSVHLKLRPHICTVCSKTYSTKKHLKAHLESHKSNYKPGSNKLYACDLCTKSFNSHRRLKVHQLGHDNKFPCKYCSMVCEGRSQYKEHITNHIKSHDSKYRCEPCFKVFMTKNSLNRHMDIIHGDTKKFICDFCGIKFSQKGCVLRHIRRHHSNMGDIPKIKSKCPICNRLFIDIEKHVKNHDEKRKNSICDICGNCFRSNALLNRHKNQKHFSASFECEVCGKKYVKEKSLRNHRFKMHGIKNEDVDKNYEVEVLID